MKSKQDDELLDYEERKKSLLSYKKIIVFIILGFMIGFVGAWAKILHLLSPIILGLPFSTFLLTLALLIKLSGSILLLIKIIRDKNKKSFLQK